MINSKIFMDSFTNLIPKETKAMFATISAVYNDGVTLIFDGTSTPTTKHYKCNTSASLAPGNRVKISKNSGTYVVEYAVGAPGGGGGGGGITTELLWENSDTTEAFAAQTVQIQNIARYKMLLVISNTTGAGSTMFVVGCDGSMDNWFDIYGSSSSYSLLFVYRRTLTLKSDGIEFTNAKSTLSSTVNNKIAVPWKIYGIK